MLGWQRFLFCKEPWLYLKAVSNKSRIKAVTSHNLESHIVKNICILMSWKCKYHTIGVHLKCFMYFSETQLWEWETKFPSYITRKTPSRLKVNGKGDSAMRHPT